MQAQRERLRAANEELELNNEQQRSQLHAIQVAIIFLCKYFFTKNVDSQTTLNAIEIFYISVRGHSERTIKSRPHLRNATYGKLGLRMNAATYLVQITAFK